MKPRPASRRSASWRPCPRRRPPPRGRTARSPRSPESPSRATWPFAMVFLCVCFMCVCVLLLFMWPFAMVCDTAVHGHVYVLGGFYLLRHHLTVNLRASSKIDRGLLDGGGAARAALDGAVPVGLDGLQAPVQRLLVCVLTRHKQYDNKIRYGTFRFRETR